MSNTPLPHLCNKKFVCEIESLCDRNALFLLVDGSAVFGRSGRIDDCVICVSPPIGITGVTLVQFRPPNSNLTTAIGVSQILIDVCNIAHVVEGPFQTSPLAPISTLAAVNLQRTTPIASQPLATRPQRELLDELCDLQSQNIGITTLGGWSIFGILGWVDDCVSVISAATTTNPPVLTLSSITIVGPAFPSATLFTLLGSFRVWSNLRTLTQVILP